MTKWAHGCMAIEKGGDSHAWTWEQFAGLDAAIDPSQQWQFTFSKLGLDGWELINVINFGDQIQYWFKRPF